MAVVYTAQSQDLQCDVGDVGPLAGYGAYSRTSTNSLTLYDGASIVASNLGITTSGGLPNYSYGVGAINEVTGSGGNTYGDCFMCYFAIGGGLNDEHVAIEYDAVAAFYNAIGRVQQPF